MLVTVTFRGLPVVTADAGRAGAVLMGFGSALGGHAALRAAGRGAADELELRDALGVALPTDDLRVHAVPAGRGLVLFARLGRGAAGVPARPAPWPGRGSAATPTA